MTDTPQIRLREFVSGERGPYTSLPNDIAKCLDYLTTLQSELAAVRWKLKEPETIQELQAAIGHLQLKLRYRVLGDQTVAVSSSPSTETTS